MTTQTPTGSVALDRSPAAVKVDNLLRQALKVSDPYDAAQIAKGLLDRYAGDAGQLERERMGLPAVRGPIAMPSSTSLQQSPAAIEVETALDELEIDLREVLTDSATKDIHAEMQGWARAIRSAASDGLGAARLALDPHQRDRAFSARRSLSEYARLSRYVGALSGGNSPLFRRLGQSCDLVANLVLVGCGEALAGGGVVRSSFILQAPVSELQVRRDAALNALRNLLGSTQYSHGPNEWPRGLEAYRQLIRRLDAAGMTDLRALFNEANLGRIFDELIDMASGSTADGLRALGATAQVSIDRIERLVAFCARSGVAHGTSGGISPESPPLASFLSALKMFAEAFDGSNRGHRLVFIARPSILTYGLYGGQGIDDQTAALLDIIMLRNRLAEQIDCMAYCDCSVDGVRRQLRLDKILFDIDRSIDYYAVGIDTASNLPPEAETAQGEIRAIAYGALMEAFEVLEAAVAGAPSLAEVNKTLQTIGARLGWPRTNPPVNAGSLPDLSLACAVLVPNANTRKTVVDHANDVLSKPPLPTDRDFDTFTQRAADEAALKANLGPAATEELSDVLFETIRERDAYGQLLHNELCLQEGQERQWERLVRALSPRCAIPGVFPANGDSAIMVMLRRAHILINTATFTDETTCKPVKVSIPPNIETSWDTYVNNVLKDGTNR